MYINCIYNNSNRAINAMYLITSIKTKHAHIVLNHLRAFIMEVLYLYSLRGGRLRGRLMTVICDGSGN